MCNQTDHIVNVDVEQDRSLIAPELFLTYYHFQPIL